MTAKIVLISDDFDFFDYMRLKLELRRSDELFSYSYDEVISKLHLLTDAIFIVNSENHEEKTLEFLKIIKNCPVVVVYYNEDETFKKKCYREGMFDYIPLTISDSEFRARMLAVFNFAAILQKNNRYREILIKNKIITKTNDIYTDYADIIDTALSGLKKTGGSAVLGAISPDEKAKFLMQTNFIETILRNSIRQNDILMNYAPNKYFILVFDTNLRDVKKLWNKICKQFPYKMYAGFTQITNQSREVLINDVLNKLHTKINAARNAETGEKSNNEPTEYMNFKLYRQEAEHKIEQIIAPVFYQMQQKYSNKFTGVSIEQFEEDGNWYFTVKGKHLISEMKITSPGFTNINIDITMRNNSEEVDYKRITLDYKELEANLLGDLLEQFMNEIPNVLNKGG